MPQKVELAACQVHVTPDDYASAETFEAMLGRIGDKLAKARARLANGAYEHPCLAVFPEMIGGFLPLAGRLDAVRDARTIDEALTKVAIRSPFRMASAMLRGKTTRTSVGFLLAVAPEVRRIYREAFSRFARRYEVWTVAGSALLPRNAHGNLSDSFSPAEGRVYNTSYTFHPSGRHIGVSRKVNLVPTVEDTLGLSPGRRGELMPFSTPFGQVGTLICYDGFAVPHTAREPDFCPLLSHYDDHGCSVVAQPAANFWPWETPWTFGGMDGRSSRKQQWLDEGLFSQMESTPLRAVRYGVTAQLLGRVFDSHFDGRSQILAKDGSSVRILAEAARGDASPEAEEVLLRVVEV
ncbi:carbon-nitrogen hydrolase family protein [Polyangium jinanense]|uniref:Carbon-nitrogen hydrolase family protein n=1 Tax=Polyangium jinanense TaxID=2829994 RepID=A0A9X3X7S5_9BACT|nr:carbon-nitrogen hydrolase family protein [Polyangium jinanense]MDC3956159.1 carbon-nitrogen hydrolase family protein [Polyangium jinanense]MDC3983006.1 carbon-nitrogen hydrolase family protein [Polyangium jinanense]